MFVSKGLKVPPDDGECDIWKHAAEIQRNVLVCNKYICGWVRKFPAWHTKAAPNGKWCERYISSSMVRLNVSVCVEIKGDCIEKWQSCFVSVSLNSWSARKILDPPSYVITYLLTYFTCLLTYLLSYLLTACSRVEIKGGYIEKW